MNRKYVRLLTLLVALNMVIGVCVYAKYIYNEGSQVNISINASLGTVAVLEHEARKNPDGTYTLETGKAPLGAGQGNSYILIPGLDVAKDPFVKIDNNSDIPAYLFIVVDTNIPDDSGVTYSLEACWKPLEGYSNVYVYSENNEALNVAGKMTNIQILQDDLIYVSQYLKPSGSVYLNFRACMGQIFKDATPEMVYESIPRN